MKSTNLKDEALDQYEELKDTAKDKYEKAKHVAQDVYANGKDQAVKSSKDWYDFMQTNPLKALLYGAVAYFAVKGVLNK